MFKRIFKIRLYFVFSWFERCKGKFKKLFAQYDIKTFKIFKLFKLFKSSYYHINDFIVDLHTYNIKYVVSWIFFTNINNECNLIKYIYIYI
jgi:hypothetical protein